MRHLGLALFFVSFSALACPDLSGTYARCVTQSEDASSQSDVIVSQQVVNGVTTYSMTSTDDETGERTTDTIAADGVPVVDVESEDGMEIMTATTTSCSGSNVLTKMEMAIDGQSIGSIDMVISKSGNTLTTSATGSIMGQDVSSVTVCQ